MSRRRHPEAGTGYSDWSGVDRAYAEMKARQDASERMTDAEAIGITLTLAEDGCGNDDPGAGMAVHRVARLLARAGYDVSLVGRNLDEVRGED